MSTELAEWLFMRWRDLEGEKKRRISQAQFARYCNIPQANMSNYLNDIREPDIDNADKIARALGPGIYKILGMSRRVPQDSKLSDIIDLWDQLTPEQQESLLKFAKRKFLNGTSEVEAV